MKHLKELWLDLYVKISAPWRDRRRERALTETISAAKLLEDLRLGTSMHFINSSNLLYQPYLPTLRRFEFNRVIMDEGSFMRFLKAHAGSLKRIKLEDICLDDRIPRTEKPSVWASFLHELKEMMTRHRCLVTGDLSGSYEGPPNENYGRTIQATISFESRRWPQSDLWFNIPWTTS